MIINDFPVIRIEDGEGDIDLGEVIVIGNLARLSGSASSDGISVVTTYVCGSGGGSGSGSSSGSEGTGEASDPMVDPSAELPISLSPRLLKDSASAGDSSSPIPADEAGDTSGSPIIIDCSEGWSGGGGAAAAPPHEDDIGILGFWVNEITPRRESFIRPQFFLGGNGIYVSFLEGGSVDVTHHYPTLDETTVTNESVVLKDSDGHQVPMRFTMIADPGFSEDSYYAFRGFPTDPSEIRGCEAYTITILGGESGVILKHGANRYTLTEGWVGEGNPPPVESVSSTFYTEALDGSPCH